MAQFFRKKGFSSGKKTERHAGVADPASGGHFNKYFAGLSSEEQQRVFEEMKRIDHEIRAGITKQGGLVPSMAKDFFAGERLKLARMAGIPMGIIRVWDVFLRFREELAALKIMRDIDAGISSELNARGKRMDEREKEELRRGRREELGRAAGLPEKFLKRWNEMVGWKK